MAWAYYNEIDDYAADWLRNLIRDGLIAPGEVDTRSIEDVCPDDLRGFTQCHFFAGVGLWSYALRLAGWDDERPIWTGSCPCQPFSSAGKGDGFGDERHLWPAFAHLAAQCGPPTICGEQVASKDGYFWLDLVQTDMEGLGYAFWPVVLPVAGVGASGERHRTFWVGLADADDRSGHGQSNADAGYVVDGPYPGWPESNGGAPGGGANGNVADPVSARGALRLSGPEYGGERQAKIVNDRCNGGFGGEGFRLADGNGNGFDQTGRGDGSGGSNGIDRNGTASRMADAPSGGFGISGNPPFAGEGGYGFSGSEAFAVDGGGWTGPLNGFWRNADWLFCTDGKWRPVEPGTRPLAYGLPRSLGTSGPGLQRLATMAGADRDSLERAKRYRVGTLKGYGNAINPWAAVEFILAWKDVAQ